MNCLNNSLEENRAEAETGAGTGAGIRARTSLGSGVEVRDGAGGVLPE